MDVCWILGWSTIVIQQCPSRMIAAHAHAWLTLAFTSALVGINHSPQDTSCAIAGVAGSSDGYNLNAFPRSISCVERRPNASTRRCSPGMQLVTNGQTWIEPIQSLAGARQADDLSA